MITAYKQYINLAGYKPGQAAAVSLKNINRLDITAAGVTLERSIPLFALTARFCYAALKLKNLN